MSESPLTQQGLPPVLADLVKFYCILCMCVNHMECDFAMLLILDNL